MTPYDKFESKDRLGNVTACVIRQEKRHL